MKYYSEAEARELVIKAGHMLLEKKLIARTWGNISARISEEEFIITPSGRGYDSLEPEDLVIVRVKDGSYEGSIKPSSEKGIHAAAYGLRKELCFIIHTHQYYASALAAECRDTRFAPCAEYGLPGTGRLRKNVETKVRQHPDKKMFLMARHGALLLGKSLEEAFELAEQLEAKSRELVEARIPDHDPEREGMIDADAVRTEAFPCVTVVRDRYIMECCRADITVAPFIDERRDCDICSAAFHNVSVPDDCDAWEGFSPHSVCVDHPFALRIVIRYPRFDEFPALRLKLLSQFECLLKAFTEQERAMPCHEKHLFVRMLSYLGLDILSEAAGPRQPVFCTWCKTGVSAFRSQSRSIILMRVYDETQFFSQSVSGRMDPLLAARLDAAFV